MRKLICTSYTEKNGRLILRNNWEEDLSSDVSNSQLREIQEKWELNEEILFHQNGISPIYCGKMDIPNVHIHVRLVITK